MNAIAQALGVSPSDRACADAGLGTLSPGFPSHAADGMHAFCEVKGRLYFLITGSLCDRASGGTLPRCRFWQEPAGIFQEKGGGGHGGQDPLARAIGNVRVPSVKCSRTW